MIPAPIVWAWRRFVNVTRPLIREEMVFISAAALATFLIAMFVERHLAANGNMLRYALAWLAIMMSAGLATILFNWIGKKIWARIHRSTAWPERNDWLPIYQLVGDESAAIFGAALVLLGAFVGARVADGELFRWFIAVALWLVTTMAMAKIFEAAVDRRFMR